MGVMPSIVPTKMLTLQRSLGTKQTVLLGALGSKPARNCLISSCRHRPNTELFTCDIYLSLIYADQLLVGDPYLFPSRKTSSGALFSHVLCRGKSGVF